MNKIKMAFLLAVSTLGFSHIAAADSLYSDKGVHPMFLSWNAAWKRLHPLERQTFAWAAKAKNSRWTVPDAPFLQAEKEIYAVARQQRYNWSKTYEVFRQRAKKSPRSTVARYAWASVTVKRYNVQRRYKDAQEALEALQQAPYVPSYQYTRVLFLLQRRGGNLAGKVFEPIGERLLKRKPKDTAVMFEQASYLSGIPTSASRKRALQLVEQVIEIYPKAWETWLLKAHIHQYWWALGKNGKGEDQSSTLAEANATYASYQKSIALAPPGEYKRRVGPESAKRIVDWKKQNGFD